MAALSAVIAAPLHYSAYRLTRLQNGLQVFIGSMLIYETSIVCELLI